MPSVVASRQFYKSPAVVEQGLRTRSLGTGPSCRIGAAVFIHHFGAEAMGVGEHGGGFALDASVSVETRDRQGLKRLLRYRAPPAFALERLREIDSEHLTYDGVKRIRVQASR